MSKWTIVLPDGSELPLDGTTGLTLTHIDGHGVPPIKNVLTDYAILDGAYWQGNRVQTRTMQLLIEAADDDESGLRALRLRLIQAINPQRLDLPITVRYYNGKGGVRELYAYYDDGMGGALDSPYNHEAIILRLLAPDPYWYDKYTRWDYMHLTGTAMAVQYILARQGLGGTWDNMAGGADNAVNDIIVDTYNDLVYACGTFTNIGGVACNRIAVWDGNVWAPLAGGSSGEVMAMAVDANGGLYAVTLGTLDGVAQFVGYWDGAAWSQPGAAVPDSFVHSLVIDNLGNVYIGGQFANIGAVPANRIAMWDGAAWNACGATAITSGDVRDLAVGPDNSVYPTGTFANVDGHGWHYIARWNPNTSTWSNLGGDPNDFVYCVEVAANGDVYIGGIFTAVNGVAANRIARWNGSSWSALGAGLNNIVYSIGIDPSNNDVYAGGTFTVAGPNPVTGGMAVWRSGLWLTGDLGGDWGGTYIGAIRILQDETIYIGGGFADAAYIVPGFNTIDNLGSANGNPEFYIHGPGRLYYIINYTTGQALYFNLVLLAGEELIIDLRPGHKTVTSSARGNMIRSLYAGDLMTFALTPGDNELSAFIWDATATAWGVWEYTPTHWSIDDGCDRALPAPMPPVGPWWLVRGFIDPSHCIAAFQPKGAASYLDSLTNLANPGVFDITEMTAPTWDAVNGWKLDDAFSQWLLLSGITITQTFSVIIRVSNCGDTGGNPCACGRANEQIWCNILTISPRNDANTRTYQNGDITLSTLAISPSNLTNGIFTIAQQNTFLNGVSDGIIPNATVFSDAGGLAVGAVIRTDAGGITAPTGFLRGYIQAFALYDMDLTPFQAIIKTDMAAL